MLDQINIENILFLDIETVPQNQSYEGLSEQHKKLWDRKADILNRQNEQKTAVDVYPRAGIYAEFGKIICISLGFFKFEKNKKTFRIKSFFGHDEKKILEDFTMLLETRFNKKKFLLCAHNGKEFDYPYLSRRIIINGLKLPAILSISGKKPWEVPHLDTMEMWKFGDYKNYTSLDLLTTALNIPTPKSEIDGSMIFKLYWEDQEIEKIMNYCQEDVIAIGQIVLRFKGLPLLEKDEIIFN